MISIIKTNNIRTENGVEKKEIELRGKSTDPKPTEGIENGTVFIEIDTETIYFFDADVKDWISKEE